MADLEKAARQHKAQMAAARILAKARAARSDRAAFFELVWTDEKGQSVVLQDFQRKWLKALDEHPRVYIEAPRGHGKSIILAAMVIFELGRNPNLRVKIVAQKDDKAIDCLALVRRQIETNKLIRVVFPELVVDESVEASKHKFTVCRTARAKDASVQACGVTSAETGSRADLIVFDDIVDLRNSIIQPQLKGTVRQKVLGEWIPILEPDGRMWIAATPYTVDDVCAYLKTQPDVVLVSTPVGIADDPFAPIWPAKWPRSELQKQFRIQGPVEYDRAYRCIALSTDAMPIQPGWIKYYDASMLGDPWALTCVTSYDLAISDGRKADYFAGIILLFNEQTGQVFVADAWRARLSLAEQAQAVIADAEAWMPSRIAFEKGGYQGAFGQYLAQQAKRPLPIWPVSPRGMSKGRRLYEATPLFQDGKVLFNPNLDPQRNPNVGQRGDIIGELLSFPLGVKDDLVDALSQALRVLQEAFPSGHREDREGFEDGDGISVRIASV